MPRLFATCVLTLVLLAAGCGGEDKEDGERRGDASPATTPREFAERFAGLTGVRLSPVRDDFVGIRLEVPSEPNRLARFGTYSLTWTADDSLRDELLGAGVRPTPKGIYWERLDGRSWSAKKPFGPRLVLEAPGAPERRVTPELERLERAVRAAYLGRPESLPPSERPCGELGLDPLSGGTGSCAVQGLPVTFVAAGERLDLPTLLAEVRGVETRERIGLRGLPPERAKGTFVIVSYRVRAKSLIRSLTPRLRLGGRTIDEAPASVFFPRSRLFPLPPDAVYRSRVAFDVAPALAARAEREGALVLPAELDDLGDPSADLAQGWIRLAPTGR